MVFTCRTRKLSIVSHVRASAVGHKVAVRAALVHVDGAPYHTDVIAIGGQQVTSDLSIMLKTPLEAAEKIKCDAGCCFMPLVEGDEEVDALERWISRATLVWWADPRAAVDRDDEPQRLDRVRRDHRQARYLPAAH